LTVLQEFKLDKMKACLEDWWPAKGDKGGNVKVLRLVGDVTDERFEEALNRRFAGASSVMSAMASEEMPAQEVKAKRALGDVNLKVQDPSGNATVVDIIGGTAKAPVLRISKDAKKAEIVIEVKAAIPKGTLKDLDDYYKAEVLVSLVSAQVDLEDEAKKKASKKGSKKNKKGEQVSLKIEEAAAVIDEVIDDLGDGEVQ
jgi:hypothetical protein